MMKIHTIMAQVLAAFLLLFLIGCDGDIGPDDSPPATVQTTTVRTPWGTTHQYMFVIHRKAGKVSRVDMDTMDVEQVKVGKRPFTMAITPDGHTVIVANKDSQTVSIIDATTLVVREAYIGAEPRDIAIRDDGKYAAVANYDGDSFSVIDLDEMNIEPFYCPDGPTSVRFTADGKTLLATSYWKPGICALDLETQEERFIDLEDAVEEEAGINEYGAQSVVPGPDGSGLEDIAFVSLRDHYNDGSMILIMDWKTGEVKRIKPLGPAPAFLTFDDDGAHFYALGKSLFDNPNWVAEFEIDENLNIHERFRFPIDRDPTAMLVSPYTNEIYVACRKKDKIKVLDTESRTHSTIHTWERPYTLAVGQNGDRLFVAHDDDEHGRISIIDANTHKVIRVKKLL